MNFFPQVLSGAPSSNRPSFSVSTFHTPISNNMTGLSLSRSPFFSPFYSGRTVYGGVSNKNTNLFRNKRARVDTATTEEPPVRAYRSITCTYMYPFSHSLMLIR